MKSTNHNTKVRFGPLLDPKQFYVGPDQTSSRHRLKVNLLGSLKFSVSIRLAEELVLWNEKKLQNLCSEFVGSISPELFQRVRDYLYTKETKSSFAIERVTPEASRAEKFARLLVDSTEQDYLTKEALVELQAKIVQEEYIAEDYRDKGSEQVYVGESISITDTRVHFVAPKQEDISALMDEFLEACHIIMDSSIPVIVKATAISYVFVYLHPFPDGNGRIHRFLIHYVFAKSNFVPNGMIFPISAVILNNPTKYDESLESFSRDLLPLIEYDLDDRGRMTVLNETKEFYRCIDLTEACSCLYWFVERALEEFENIPTEVIEQLEAVVQESFKIE